MIVVWEFTQVINAEESLNIPSVPGIRKKTSLVSTRGSPAQQLWATLIEDRSEIGPEIEFHNLHVSKKLYWAISAIPTLNKVQSAWHMHHCPFQPQTLQRSSRSHLGHHTNGKGGSICFPIPCLSTGRYHAQKLFVWTLIYLYLFATKIIGGVKRKLREGNLTLFLSLFPARIFKKITNYPELTLLLWNPYRKLEGKKVSLPFLSLFRTLTYPYFKILPPTYDIKKKFHHVLREYGVGKSQV